MSKKRTASAQVPPDLCFVEELAGETPPSFAAMQRLYGLASDLFGLLPWQMLDESQLIVVRDSASGELCYCSVMGALGEVYSVHASTGAEGLRTFRKLEADELADPGEFFATMRSVYVEFVPQGRVGTPGSQTTGCALPPAGPWACVAYLPHNTPRLSSLVCYCGRGAHAGRVHSRGGGALHSCRQPEESELLE